MRKIAVGVRHLAWAAERGNEGVVKILLEREDINPDGEASGLRHSCGQLETGMRG